MLAHELIAMNLLDFFQTQESVTKMVSLLDLQFQNVNTYGIEAQIKIFYQSINQMKQNYESNIKFEIPSSIF